MFNVTIPLLAVVFFFAAGVGGLVPAAVLGAIHGWVVGTRPMWDAEYRLDKPYGWGLLHAWMSWYGLVGLMAAIGLFIVFGDFIWIWLFYPAVAAIPGIAVCMATVAVSRRRARRDTADTRVEVADATNLP
ncbi:MAG: hypothetical protein LBE07_10995 [Gordonia sp. (in: high G+C Gram-positive bacteria)]|nr:hypothetical protein [Gordonia sp. (in: high G+C Gram-positive bacteria)]